MTDLGTIRIIKEVFGDNDIRRDYQGFAVFTDKVTVFFGIEIDQQCCEISGHIASTDEFTPFIGSALVSVSVVDEALKTYNLKLDEFETEDRGTNYKFINLVTTMGVLQFAVYNKHNGYYGHEVFFWVTPRERSKFLKDFENQTWRI